MLLTGDRIPATQALTLGLVDELVPSEDLVSAATDWVERASRISFCSTVDPERASR
jgi:enoyl-CoA hydratase/carnithine racemase